uniref:DDE_Tnp_1_7 domain-containing protein n=1 Tax=Glossina austeni TaxID=7395 RepID=A0A1A9V134_GLOAU
MWEAAVFDSELKDFSLWITIILSARELSIFLKDCLICSDALGRVAFPWHILRTCLCPLELSLFTLKYGIKFYELCAHDGYALNLDIYKGKVTYEVSSLSVVDSVVMRLMEPYLLKGHALFMDNYYNSVGLSNRLLSFKTHTTGTLRTNRKMNPKVVTQKKLKKGEHIWRIQGNVYISKWKDKRDVLCITTKSHPKLIDVHNKYGISKKKPIEFANYNANMSGIVRCDQMIAYYSSPKKSIRWYKKNYVNKPPLCPGDCLRQWRLPPEDHNSSNSDMES